MIEHILLLFIQISTKTQPNKIFNSFEDWCGEKGNSSMFKDILHVMDTVEESVAHIQVTSNEFASNFSNFQDGPVLNLPLTSDIVIQDTAIPFPNGSNYNITPVIDDVVIQEGNNQVFFSNEPNKNVILDIDYAGNIIIQNNESVSAENNQQILDNYILELPDMSPISECQLNCPVTIQQDIGEVSSVSTEVLKSSFGSNFSLGEISNLIFDNNKEFPSSSRRLSDLDITEDSQKIEEYCIIRNKIRVPKKPTEEVILENKRKPKNISDSTKKYNAFQFSVGAFDLKMQEKMFLDEHFNNLTDKTIEKDFIKFIEDMVRENYKKINNVCPINYTSHGFTKDRLCLRLYGKCLHANKTCRRYKFVTEFKDSGISVKVYSDRNEIKHPKNNKKIQQVRAVRRNILKNQLKNEFASTFRNKKLTEMSKSLQIVGNMGDLVTGDVSRKMKSETLRRFDRDNDALIDVILMQKDKNWTNFIQKISNPMEIYLFSRDQLMLTQTKKKSFLKSSRNTIFIDSTGGIVSKFDKNSKRVFLYSLILHIKDDTKKGLVIPLAEALICRHYEEDIRGFFMDLKTFCLVNNITWPPCKRVVVDWSWALINSSIKAFNEDIGSLSTYLIKCFSFLTKQKQKINFVVLQICYCHFIKIILKDVEKYADNIDQSSCYQSMLIRAVNISTLDQVWTWFEAFATILLSIKKDNNFNNALKIIRKIKPEEASDEKISEKSAYTLDDEYTPMYKKSPFYKKGLHICLKVKQKIANSNAEGPVNNLNNEHFMELVLKRYIPFVPMWTNIMGAFVDSSKTRISNSPVEGYFSIVKNILLKGKRNVRASEYIRISKQYIHAKIREIEVSYTFADGKNSNKRDTNKMLVEERWGRTPKKDKSRLNKTIVHGEKVMKRYIYDREYYNTEGLTRQLRDVKVVVGDYKHIFQGIYNSPRPFQVASIYLHEFASLNPGKQLYNNIVDIYIHILLFELKILNVEVCTCEEGKAILFENLYKNFKHMFNINNTNLIIIPILHLNHFTFLYANCTKKYVDYIDPVGGNNIKREIMTAKFFKALQNFGYVTNDWVIQKTPHLIQRDSYNCGVYCCQFIEALLKDLPLTGISNTDLYRNIMKDKLLAFTKDMSDTCLHCEGELPLNIEKTKCKQCNRTVDLECLQKFYSKDSLLENFTCILCHRKV